MQDQIDFATFSGDHNPIHINEKLLVLADDYDVPFVSLADLSKTEGLDVAYTYDGIHLTEKGYMYWVKQIESLLE